MPWPATSDEAASTSHAPPTPPRVLGGGRCPSASGRHEDSERVSHLRARGNALEALIGLVTFCLNAASRCKFRPCSSRLTSLASHHRCNLHPDHLTCAMSSPRPGNPPHRSIPPPPTLMWVGRGERRARLCMCP